MQKFEVKRPLMLNALIEELDRGSMLLLELSDHIYSAEKNGTGSVGGHFRHNLDFVNGFLNGIETGRIDYNKRERDTRVETDRLYAVSRFADAIGRLRCMSPDSMSSVVEVASELNSSIRHGSSVSRELEFIHSHTVHHHALIAEKLAGFGIRIGSDFGVAPSTLEYWQRKAA